MNIGDCINHPIPNSRNALQWLGIGWSLQVCFYLKIHFVIRLLGVDTTNL